MLEPQVSPGLQRLSRGCIGIMEKKMETTKKGMKVKGFGNHVQSTFP